MNPGAAPAPGDPTEEIPALIEILRVTERRLAELTAGEVDAVTDQHGRTFLLQRAQEQLRQSEASRQAAILNALPAHIALLDAQGFIRSVNERWRQFDRENSPPPPIDPIGLNYLELCERAQGEGSAGAQQLAAGIRSVLEGRSNSFSVEYAYGSPTGQRWYLHRVAPASTDPLAGAVVMRTNITERKKAEEALRESEARFRATFEQAAVGIAHVSPEGRFLRVNDKLCDIVGYSRAELLELTFADLTAPEDLAASYEARRAIVAGEISTYSIEKRYRRKNGEMVWTNLVATMERTAAGEAKYFISVFEDITQRKRTEAVVRRLAAIVESSADAIISKNLDGIVTSWNPAAETMFGYTAAEIIGRPLQLIIPPDRLDEETEILTDFARGEIVRHVETIRLRKDGGRFDVSITISPIMDPAGSIIGASKIVRDITELKQAAETLEALSQKTAQRERMLTTMLSAASDFFYVFNREGRFLFANQPLLDLWGVTLDQAVGRNFFDLKYPDALAKHLNQQIQEVFETKRSITGETPYTSPTGKAGHYEYIFSPAFANDGTVDFVVGSTRDITGRKQAELEVRFNEQRFRSLVEATSAIVWDTPASGEFEVPQPSWTAFTGQSFAELRGWGWLNAVHPDDQDESARVWSAAVASRSIYRVEHRLRARDQTYHNMTVRAVPILAEDGTIRQWIGVHTDITEQRRLEAQFLRVQRTESIGALASGIAHDLNNILAPILMSVQLIRLGMPPDKLKTMLDTLESCAIRGGGMVKQVLMFARGVEGERTQLHPKRLVQEIERIIQETFPRTIEIKTEVVADCSSVLGDFTQLQQVLLNLCVNARDAMPEGGRLTISAANVTVDAHFAAMNLGARPGPHVVLQVIDTGSGIPQGIIDKIFDPFFTTKEVGKGTGLGLSTLQAIVKGHGGFVQVYSELKRGTAFKIYLPSALQPGVDSAPPIPSNRPRGNGELLLVVDDEEPIRHVTKSTLEAFGYRVLLAQDGAEAVSLFALHRDDVALVITDMMMPIMDGPSAIVAINHIRPGIRIIATSGLTSMRDLSKAIPTVVKYHLQKPYTADKLLQTVQLVLQG